MIGVAIITARKNSLRLKKKNHLKIEKKTLVERSIYFANKLKFIKHIVLTTDDEVLIGKKYKVPLIKINRPKFLTKKKSSSYAAIKHALKCLKKMKINYDYILVLQPTSPFRSIKSTNLGFKKFKKFKKKYSVVSVSKTKNPLKHKLEITNNKLNFTKNKNYFQINGNFYFAGKKFLFKNKSFFKKNITIPILQNKKLSIDIDRKKDYLLAKKISSR